MSEQAARELIERMKTDETLRDRVFDGADLEGRMAVVRAEGFDCTAEEIAAHVESLDDAELDGVAGGSVCWCLSPPASPGWDL